MCLCILPFQTVTYFYSLHSFLSIQTLTETNKLSMVKLLVTDFIIISFIVVSGPLDILQMARRLNLLWYHRTKLDHFYNLYGIAKAIRTNSLPFLLSFYIPAFH